MANVEALAQDDVDDSDSAYPGEEPGGGDTHICMKAADGENVTTKFCYISSCERRTAKKGKLVNETNCLN